jgi:hypothetical protein
MFWKCKQCGSRLFVGGCNGYDENDRIYEWYLECDECYASDVFIKSIIINYILTLKDKLHEKWNYIYKPRFSKQNILQKIYRFKWRNKKKWCSGCLKYVNFTTNIGYSYHGEREFNFWCNEERNEKKQLYSHWLSYTRKSKDVKFTYIQPEGKCKDCGKITDIHSSNEPMCLSCQKKMNERHKKSHNCFNHDYDGGVCLICGSNGHREALNSALGLEDDYYQQY